MAKTTVNVPDDLWDEFSIKVIKERGHGKKGKVIRELIKNYVERNGDGEGT